MIAEDDVKYITIYLAGAFPNIKFDGVGTALAWEDTLNKLNATREECETACEKIIKYGFNDWEVNLSLVCDMIRNQREMKESELLTRQEFDRIIKLEKSLPPREKRVSMFKKIRESI